MKSQLSPHLLRSSGFRTTILPRQELRYGVLTCMRTSRRQHISNGHGQQIRRRQLSREEVGVWKQMKAFLSSGIASGTRPKMGGTTGTSLFRVNLLWQDLKTKMSEILGKPRTLPIPRWVSPTPYSVTLSECFGHSSFLLVAASYAVDDHLQLRMIAVAGSTAMLVFTYFHPHGKVLWLPFKWNMLFIALNSYRIGKFYFERYLAEQLSDELRDLRSKHFYIMDSADFSKVVRLGKIETHKKGDVVVRQEEPNHLVRLVLCGGLTVFYNDKITYSLEEGNFISEAGLHAGLMLPGKVVSCGSVVADTDVRVLTWDRTAFVELMANDIGVQRALKAVLSWDVVSKLKHQREILSSGAVEDPKAWTQRRQDQTELRYRNILKQLLASHPDNMKLRKKELEKYRTIHHIDDKAHEVALEACGWSRAEFEAAGKQGEWTSESASHMRWFLRDFWIRMIR